MLIVLGGKEVV